MDRQLLKAELAVPIKANLTIEEVKQIVLNLYDVNAASINELNGYDDRNYYVSDQNGIDLVLKIINSTDSKKPEIFEAQSLLLEHLANNGIPCSIPIKTNNGKYFELHALTTGKHIIRALRYIKGTILAKVPWTTDLLYQIGESVARMNNAMKTFKHPAYDNYKSLWLLESVPQILNLLSVIEDPEKKRIVASVVEEFKRKILPISKTLPRGLIHGDINEQNIIVNKDSKVGYIINGVIDYGDCHVGCYLYELSITMVYMMLLAKDIGAGGYVFAGYSSVRPVSNEECFLIKVCTAARLCQSLVIGAYVNRQDPANLYVLTTATHGWQLLTALWNERDEDILEKWKSIAKEKVF